MAARLGARVFESGTGDCQGSLSGRVEGPVHFGRTPPSVLGKHGGPDVILKVCGEHLGSICSSGK